MKKLFILLLSALSLTAFAQNKSVAILNSLDREGNVSSAYKIIVRSSFESVASITQGYEAFDRTALDAIMSEHDFQRSGAVNDAEIRQIGQIAGVDYVLVTEVSAESDYLVVQAKILNVVTAKYDRAVDDLMQMTPPAVKEGCTMLAQKLFRINIQTGNQKGEIMYDGDRYVGEYRDGKPNGKGKLYYSENENGLLTYEGDFADGVRHGYGILIWDDGTRYEGNWVNNDWNGKGKIQYSNGTIYDGEWNNGEKTYGTEYYKSGDKYIGHFYNGDFNGEGTYYYSGGDKYVGKWEDGKENGEGTYYFSGGDKYVGEWKDGKKNGRGTLYFSKGKSTGTWVNGVEHGSFRIDGHDHWWIGEYVNGEKKGTWCLYWKGEGVIKKIKY